MRMGLLGGTVLNLVNAHLSRAFSKVFLNHELVLGSSLCVPCIGGKFPCHLHPIADPEGNQERNLQGEKMVPQSFWGILQVIIMWSSTFACA